MRRSWRLNERHYGALQGKDKAQTREEYGEEQFMLWRRSYDVPPPPIDDGDPHSQSADPRYALLPANLRPRTECLKDVVGRMLPYWYDAVIPDLPAGRTVLVVAHGNSIRALVKHLDDVGDAEIAGLDIPTGIPLIYELDASFRPVTRAAATWTRKRPPPRPRPWPARAGDRRDGPTRVRSARRPCGPGMHLLANR